MASKTTKPKNKDRLVTEERLLLAAEQIFSRHGFKGATTRMIAKKADVNVALIARYFDGKFGLMVKLIESKANSSRYVELAYPPQATLSDECLQFLFFRLNLMLEDINIFKVVIIQFLTDPKFLKRFQKSTKVFEKHPQFEKRIQTLINQKKIASNVTPFIILNTIETFLFGMIIDKIIIHSTEAHTAKESLRHFVKHYCGNLEIE